MLHKDLQYLPSTKQTRLKKLCTFSKNFQPLSKGSACFHPFGGERRPFTARKPVREHCQGKDISSFAGRRAMYSEKVMEHFSNPRNVGEIKDSDGVGEVGNPVCGDMMAFYIKVEADRLVDVKFKTFGCVAAISVSSMVSEMAKGKT